MVSQKISAKCSYPFSCSMAPLVNTNATVSTEPPYYFSDLFHLHLYILSIVTSVSLIRLMQWLEFCHNGLHVKKYQTCSLSWNPLELASGLVPVAGRIKILTCVMMGVLQPLHKIRSVVCRRLLFVREVLKASRRTDVSHSQTLCCDCVLVRRQSLVPVSLVCQVPSTCVSLLISCIITPHCPISGAERWSASCIIPGAAEPARVFTRGFNLGHCAVISSSRKI